MSYQREREGFIAAMSREGLSVNAVRTILREANSVQRLAVDDCNGVQWEGDRVPFHAHNGSTVPGEDWTACGAGPGSMIVTKRPAVTCPSCKSTFHEARITKALNGSGITAEFHGDPRGYTVKLAVNGREIGVPTRSY